MRGLVLNRGRILLLSCTLCWLPRGHQISQGFRHESKECEHVLKVSSLALRGVLADETGLAAHKLGVHWCEGKHAHDMRRPKRWRQSSGMSSCAKRARPTLKDATRVMHVTLEWLPNHCRRTVHACEKERNNSEGFNRRKQNAWIFYHPCDMENQCE